jgi:hypothetical protein
MMEYMLEMWKNRENALLKKISKLDFPKNILHIFSQTNVFVGFCNKKGVQLFETCLKFKFKKHIFSSK